jgi:hypothetical protein
MPPLRAEEIGPPWARAWDAVSRQAYRNGADTDWDGLNDDEEAIGLVLWGAAGSADQGWVSGPGVSEIAEWNWSGIDDDVQPVELPFAFLWGTQSWTSIWVGVNGTLGFERGQSSPVPRPLPAASAGPYPFFGVFWQQLYLDPAAGGRVWTWAPETGRFVICWENLWLSNAVNSRISFQAELRRDGSMIWRYRDLNDGRGGVASAVLGAQRDDRGWWCVSDSLAPGAALLLVPLTGVSATNADSDGDGVADGVEFFYAHRPGSLPEQRLDPARPDNPGDCDRDGLDVTAEYLYGRLDPFYWDSDGDMLGDGYEVASRLLAYDATGIHGLQGDGDGDGISNLKERLHRCQPRLADSDGDGRRDPFEIAIGANPAGAGAVASSAWLAPVNVVLGDPGLDGATEAYEMRLDAVSGDTRSFTFQNSAYGVVQTQTLWLAIGATYRVSLNHLGSVRAANGFADPDYEARIEGVDGTVLDSDDPAALLGRHLASGSVPPGVARIDTNRQATLWIQSRMLPDGTIPVADPRLTPEMSAWSAGRAGTVGALPADQLAAPGVLVLPNAFAVGAITPARLRVHALGGVAGVTRWLRFSDPSRITLQRSGGAATVPTDVVQVEGDIAVNADYDIRMQGNWAAGTQVRVDYLLRNTAGQILAIKSARLLGPVIFAVGDSMTYGVRRRRDGTMETPNWGNPWLSYPSPSSWNGYYGLWNDPDFQGIRGFLLGDLTAAVPWIGHDANGHGPNHCGYSGSRTYDINETMANTARTYPRAGLLVNPSHTIVLYWIGLNDTSRSDSATEIFNRWKMGIDQIMQLRAGRGRTLIVGVTLPRIRSDYSGYSRDRQTKQDAVNAMIRGYQLSAPHARYVVADIESVPHDSNDDGLHFMATGYRSVEMIVRQAIINGLVAGP